MAGEVVLAGEKALLGMLAGVIEESEVGASYWRAEVSAEELYAMARGLRESCGTREEFLGRGGRRWRVVDGWAVSQPERGLGSSFIFSDACRCIETRGT
jgi:hypothetical protein